MGRASLTVNIKRILWAECGGFCENPKCNKYLFAEIDQEVVTLANIAHIIGLGKKSPRSEHDLANYINKNGYDNLIMLCLDCHTIVDEIESRFSVEEIRAWKINHALRIRSLFNVPEFEDESELLKEINDLLDKNREVFETYGPFSKLALDGQGGDAQKIWKRRCLDTIMPNNQRIIDIFEKNKRKFGFPWEAYRNMLGYKVHADSFRENCLIAERINDYKLFPVEFDFYVKSRLGIQVEKPETREREEIDYRRKTIDDYISKFLPKHSFVNTLNKWNRHIFEVGLVDGRNLRVFVTNTYHFSEYTFEKILIVDPNIDAIICSNPYADYAEGAKKLCIENRIGLFMLAEFMGALPYEGERFLSFLLKKERQDRITRIAEKIGDVPKLRGRCSIYLMGSYLRSKIYRDIDILFVYKDGIPIEDVDYMVEEFKLALTEWSNLLHLTVCSQTEFWNLKLKHDNTVQVL